MTVLITTDYRDKRLGRWVSAGEELTVTKQRGEQIIAAGYGLDGTEKEVENDDNQYKSSITGQ